MSWVSKKYLFFAFIFIGLLSCDSASHWNDKVTSLESETNSSSDQQGIESGNKKIQDGHVNGRVSGTISNNDGKKITKSFSLVVKTTETQTNKTTPINIVFILDTSRSMLEPLKEFGEKIVNFFNGLYEAGLPYTTRIVTMDNLLAQLKSTNADSKQVMAPAKLFDGPTPNYNRGSLDSIYSEISVFGGESAGIEFLKEFNRIDPNSLSEIEPGLMIIDQMLWAKFNSNIDETKKYQDDRITHFITLANEDNNTEYGIFNHNEYEQIDSKEIYVYQETQLIENCRDVTRNQDQYCYSYTNEYSTTNYDYSYSYLDEGVCQKKGVATANEIDTLNVIQTKKWYVTNEYKCDKVTKTETKYRCSDENNYSILANYDYSASGNAQRERCELAQVFQCVQYYDNDPVSVVKNRSEALSLIAKGVECVPSELSKDWTTSTIYSRYKSQAGIRSCRAFSCTPEIKETIQKGIAVLEKDLDTNVYRNCTTIPTSTKADQTAAFELKTDSQGLLTEIVHKLAPDQSAYGQETTYDLITLSSPQNLSELKFCGNNLNDIAIPTDLSFVKTGDSKNQIISGTLTKSRTLNNSQIASELGISENALISTNKTGERTTPHSETKNLGCYATQHYDLTDPIRNKKDFKEELTQTEITDKICEEPTITKLRYKPTVEGFTQLMEKFYPTLQYTFHTIGDKNNSSQYQELTKRTNGVFTDINDDYIPFMKDLTTYVTQEKILVYSLPSNIDKDFILKISNKTQNRDLLNNNDYNIIANKIVLKEDACEPGDEIVVLYEEIAKEP